MRRTIVLAALLLALPASAQQDFSKVEIKARKAADGLWMLTGAGGNIGVSAGAVLVAHENVRKRMSKDQFIKLLNRTVPASPAGALPLAHQFVVRLAPAT